VIKFLNGVEEKIEKKTINKEEEYYGVGSFVLEIIKIILLAFIIIFPIRVFVFQPFFVQGASMEPNFEDGEYLIVNELGYKKTIIGTEGKEFLTIKPFKNLTRQQSIVFRFPLDEKKYFIKRVIGLPGEKVEIKNNQVKIYNQENPDGFALNEREYLASSVRTVGDLVITLDPDEYFVMGDNRMFSSDSRAWGPVKDKDIIGKVLLRAWPLGRIEVF